MSILQEKDVESGIEPFPDFVDDNNYASDPLPSSIRLTEKRPLFIRALPPNQQLLLLDLYARFLHYWYYPIPLPSRVERAQNSLQLWWSHPLPQSTPTSMDRRFQRWWLAPDHVWRRRRGKIVLAFVLFYFILLVPAVKDMVPPDTQRDWQQRWDERVGSEGCRALGCLETAWDVGKEMMKGDERQVVDRYGR